MPAPFPRSDTPPTLFVASSLRRLSPNSLLAIRYPKLPSPGQSRAATTKPALFAPSPRTPCYASRVVRRPMCCSRDGISVFSAFPAVGVRDQGRRPARQSRFVAAWRILRAWPPGSHIPPNIANRGVQKKKMLAMFGWRGQKQGVGVIGFEFTR